MTSTANRRENRFMQALNEVVPEYGDIVKPVLALTIVGMFVWGRWFPEETSFEANLGLMAGSIALLVFWVLLHFARRRYVQRVSDEQLNSSSLDEINAQR